MSASCLFVSVTDSNPYNIADLTATLYTFPFILAGTRLSQITPDILLHPFHPACTLFFTSLLHVPSLCTIEPIYLTSSTSPCIFTVSLTCLAFAHMYSVVLLLTFIPLLYKAYIQLSSLSSTCPLLSLQTTIPSANIMVYGASSLIASVILSITISNKQGLKADHWCSPTFTSNPSVTPTAPFTAVVLPSYISSSLPIQTFSCNTTHLLLAPCHKLSPGPQTHNVSPSDLLCTSFKASNASVVIFPGMKPYCCSVNVNSLLNILSTTLSRGVMV